MRKVSIVTGLAVVFTLILSAAAFTLTIKNWEDVLKADQAPAVYVENVTDSSGSKLVDASNVTKLVKEVFEKRLNPKFKMSTDKAKADIVFEGTIQEFVWQEKAPVTDIYGAAPLAMDMATASGKNYARMTLKYSVTDPSTGKVLLEQDTLVSLKQPGIPEDKSFKMICSRAPKILARDLFRKYKTKR